MNVCGKLFQDFQNPCKIPVNGYRQLAVLIPLSAIDKSTIVIGEPAPDTEQCDYTVEFELLCETKGRKLVGLDAGTSIKGYFEKSRNDQGYPTYIHHVDVILSGIDIETKCFLSQLDAGRYAVAVAGNDGTIEIYGFNNGLTTGDYTYDIVESGGTNVITLSSLDTQPEGKLPLVYKSSTPGNELLDFESAFENVTPCA